MAHGPLISFFPFFFVFILFLFLNIASTVFAIFKVCYCCSLLGKESTLHFHYCYLHRGLIFKKSFILFYYFLLITLSILLRTKLIESQQCRMSTYKCEIKL